MIDDTEGQDFFSFIDPLEGKASRDTWESHWNDMPSYNNIWESPPEVTAKFKFKTVKDYEEFKRKVRKYLYEDIKPFDGQQGITEKQAWFPHKEKDSSFIYNDSSPINPRYPIYIVSKGRFTKNPTSISLFNMNIPFYVIVEENEYDSYCANEFIDNDKVLILPEKYKDEYDVFWDDDDKRTGPGAARNFAWDHSIENGYDWHWVMDDNIENFFRLDDNKKIQCNSGTMFYSCEDFILRYKNIAQAGLQYFFFVPSRESRPAYRVNTRIYSCLLIRNDVPFRWRGRYNEDTDLSLRMMKENWCTVQFNHFLQGKMNTQQMRGGNSDEFYDGEGTLNKSQMLVDMHPDVTSLVWRYERWHHYVDYSSFAKKPLILKEGLEIPKDDNNYGLTREKKIIGVK